MCKSKTTKTAAAAAVTIVGTEYMNTLWWCQAWTWCVWPMCMCAVHSGHNKLIFSTVNICIGLLRCLSFYMCMCVRVYVFSCTSVYMYASYFVETHPFFHIYIQTFRFSQVHCRIPTHFWKVSRCFRAYLDEVWRFVYAPVYYFRTLFLVFFSALLNF